MYCNYVENGVGQESLDEKKNHMKFALFGSFIKMDLKGRSYICNEKVK